MQSVLRPWMFVAAASLALGVLLQTPIGFLLLFLGILLWWPLTIHSAMLLLAWDSWRRKSPRILLVIPAAFYAAGIAYCVIGLIDAARLEHEVAARNTGAVAAYNSSHDAIIVNPGQMANILTAGYTADTVYVEARHRQRQAARRSLWDGDYLTAALDARHYGEAAQLRTKQARRLLTPDEALTLPEEGQLLFVSGKGLKPIYAQKWPYYTRLEMAGYYLPNPYHPPLDVVLIPSRGGARRARVITERVPAHLAHYPQHQRGTISYPEGYRPF